ncbi:MAG: Ig-like domain-containing protein [Deltaproteobacteria bacterium]|nr:Ig-like domain-containing protein [Deltaproteobacteria bacterium]
MMMISKLQKRSLVLIGCSLLFRVIVACGGGGSDASTEDSTLTSAADAAPEVSGVSLTRSTGIDLDATISFTSDSALDPTTVTTSSYTVTPAESSTSICTSITASSDNLTFTCNYSGELDPLTTYTLALTTAVESDGGTALEAAYTSTFTTGCTESDDFSENSLVGDDDTNPSCWYLMNTAESPAPSGYTIDDVWTISDGLTFDAPEGVWIFSANSGGDGSIGIKKIVETNPATITLKIETFGGFGTTSQVISNQNSNVDAMVIFSISSPSASSDPFAAYSIEFRINQGIYACDVIVDYDMSSQQVVTPSSSPSNVCNVGAGNPIWLRITNDGSKLIASVKGSENASYTTLHTTDEQGNSAAMVAALASPYAVYINPLTDNNDGSMSVTFESLTVE